MSIWQILGVSALCFVWFLLGAAVSLWAYYHGLKGTNPLPNLASPVASLFHRRNGKAEPEGEDDNPLPRSLQRS